MSDLEKLEILRKYRSMSLGSLLRIRLYGTYVPGLIEQVIFEKVGEE